MFDGTQCLSHTVHERGGTRKRGNCVDGEKGDIRTQHVCARSLSADARALLSTGLSGRPLIRYSTPVVGHLIRRSGGGASGCGVLVRYDAGVVAADPSHSWFPRVACSMRESDMHRYSASAGLATLRGIGS